MDRRALLDANVIYPVWLCDLFLRLAHAGIYRPLWNAEILDEARRNVVQNNPGIEPIRIEARFSTMRRHFPEAMVEGYEALTPVMANDPKDRHVLAAAIIGGADLIVTNNVRDFPEHSRRPYEIELETSDDFALGLFTENPDETLLALKAWSDILENPLLTVENILTRLERSVPNFCAAIHEAWRAGG